MTVEDFLLTMLPLNYILICVRLRFPAAAAFLAICFAIFALAIFRPPRFDHSCADLLARLHGGILLTGSDRSLRP